MTVDDYYALLQHGEPEPRRPPETRKDRKGEPDPPPGLAPGTRERLRQRLQAAGYPEVPTDLLEAFHRAWRQEFAPRPETAPPPDRFALTPQGRAVVQEGRKGTPG